MASVRPTRMRRTLGNLTATALAVLALAVTAACGSSSSMNTNAPGGPAYDPAGDPSRSPGPVAGARLLPLISMTGGGGRPSASAMRLDAPAEMSRFVGQFGSPAMQHRLRSLIRGVQVPAGHALVGQVVAVGCDRPPGVDVVVDKAGRLELRPQPVPSPLEECLAAVTTVAFAIVPDA